MTAVTIARFLTAGATRRFLIVRRSDCSGVAGHRNIQHTVRSWRRHGSRISAENERYANDPLKYWFDNLTSSNGKCCSFADGFSVSDVDWDTEDGHYRVLLHGEWINVPNSSVVTEPNRYGPAVVWPYMDGNGNIYIRCFLPGSGV
jgi:hypothetical protein